MNVLLVAILVFAVGVGAVLAVRAISRRVNAWADAMILSFGLLKGLKEKEEPQEDLPRCDCPSRQVIPVLAR